MPRVLDIETHELLPIRLGRVSDFRMFFKRGCVDRRNLEGRRLFSDEDNDDITYSRDTQKLMEFDTNGQRCILDTDSLV